MTNKKSSEYKDTARWTHEQAALYGQKRAISSKALVELGAAGACIIQHLWFLQNYNPKGGHIPYTPDEKRASFSTFEQIHEYLPFIPLRTIKDRVTALCKLDGFTKFKYASQRANHYYITDELAEALGLDDKKKLVYFHPLEAQLYGILEAILVQRVAYCNVRLSAPFKQSTRIDLCEEFHKYAKDKRKVKRAIDRLSNYAGNFGGSLLTFDPEDGHVIGWARELFASGYKDALNKRSKIALVEDQSCTLEIPDLPTGMPNLPTKESPFDMQNVRDALVTTAPASLNSSKYPSRRKRKGASQPHSFLPPTVSLIDGKWIEFDCRTPFTAAPAMVPAEIESDDGMKVPLSRLKAEPETVTVCTETRSDAFMTSPAPMERAEPSPCLPIDCAPPESIKPCHNMQSGIGTVLLRARVSKYYPPTFKDGKRHDEDFLLDRFNQVVKEGKFIPDFDDSIRFRDELRQNPELGQAELEMVYRRIIHSETAATITHDGKFNPYFYSTRLHTAKQLIGNFYLILEDEYRVSAKEKYAKNLSKNALHGDTPEHIRRYITRKRAASNN